MSFQRRSRSAETSQDIELADLKVYEKPLAEESNAQEVPKEKKSDADSQVQSKTSELKTTATQYLNSAVDKMKTAFQAGTDAVRQGVDAVKKRVDSFKENKTPAKVEVTEQKKVEASSTSKKQTKEKRGLLEKLKIAAKQKEKSQPTVSLAQRVKEVASQIATKLPSLPKTKLEAVNPLKSGNEPKKVASPTKAKSEVKVSQTKLSSRSSVKVSTSSGNRSNSEPTVSVSSRSSSASASTRKPSINSKNTAINSNSSTFTVPLSSSGTTRVSIPSHGATLYIQQPSPSNQSLAQQQSWQAGGKAPAQQSGNQESSTLVKAAKFAAATTGTALFLEGMNSGFSSDYSFGEAFSAESLLASAIIVGLMAVIKNVMSSGNENQQTASVVQNLKEANNQQHLTVTVVPSSPSMR